MTALTIPQLWAVTIAGGVVLLAAVEHWIRR